MTMSRRLVPAVALCVAASGARAQDYVPTRNGMTATFGVGISSAGLNCTPACASDRRSGPTFQVRGAAAVAPQLTLAIEGNSFQQNTPTASGSASWRLLWVTIGALWYPREDEDFFVKIGVGGTILHANPVFDSVGAINLNTRDVGLVLGVGRDYRLSDSYGLTLYADFLTAPRSIAYLHNSDSGARLGADVLNVGLGFSVF
ncbi:MAG TPA: hypothetical protein VG916_11780 [Gemmatimonadaceae bacterium]|nr:hypothetical protein [Gemmatimonadaceae bacterium]